MPKLVHVSTALIHSWLYAVYVTEELLGLHLCPSCFCSVTLSLVDCVLFQTNLDSYGVKGLHFYVKAALDLEKFILTPKATSLSCVYRGRTFLGCQEDTSCCILSQHPHLVARTGKCSLVPKHGFLFILSTNGASCHFPAIELSMHANKAVRINK